MSSTILVVILGPKWERKDEMKSTESTDASIIQLDRGDRLAFVCMEDGTIWEILTQRTDGEILAHVGKSVMYVLGAMSRVIFIRTRTCTNRNGGPKFTMIAQNDEH